MKAAAGIYQCSRLRYYAVSVPTMLKMFVWCVWILILKWSEIIGLDNLRCPSSWGMWATANAGDLITDIKFASCYLSVPTYVTRCVASLEKISFSFFPHALFHTCCPWDWKSSADSLSGTQTLLGVTFGFGVRRSLVNVTWRSCLHVHPSAELTRRGVCWSCFGFSSPGFCSAAAAAQAEEPDPVSQ